MLLSQSRLQASVANCAALLKLQRVLGGKQTEQSGTGIHATKTALSCCLSQFSHKFYIPAAAYFLQKIHCRSGGAACTTETTGSLEPAVFLHGPLLPKHAGHAIRSSQASMRRQGDCWSLPCKRCMCLLPALAIAYFFMPGGVMPNRQPLI